MRYGVFLSLAFAFRGARERTFLVEARERGMVEDWSRLGIMLGSRLARVRDHRTIMRAILDILLVVGSVEELSRSGLHVQ